MGTDQYYKHRRLDKICQLGGLLIKRGSWLGLAFFAVQAIGHIAGKSTDADISVVASIFSNIGEKCWPPWLVALFAILLYLSERRAKGRKTEVLQQRNIQLELKLDPDRSSSDLRPDGRTREDDLL